MFLSPWCIKRRFVFVYRRAKTAIPAPARPAKAVALGASLRVVEEMPAALEAPALADEAMFDASLLRALETDEAPELSEDSAEDTAEDPEEMAEEPADDAEPAALAIVEVITDPSVLVIVVMIPPAPTRPPVAPGRSVRVEVMAEPAKKKVSNRIWFVFDYLKFQAYLSLCQLIRE